MQIQKCSTMRVRVMLAMTGMLACLAMTACQTGGPSRHSEAAVTSVIALRADLVAARLQVQQNIDATDALADSGATLPKAFAAFERENEETRNVADQAAKRSASLRVNADHHMSAWQLELSKLSSAQLRAAGNERQELVRKHFDAIRDKSAQAKGAYTPFMNNLTDLEVYLQQDMTIRGVNASKATITQIDDSGKALIKSLEACISSLDAFTADMANVQPVNAPATR